MTETGHQDIQRLLAARGLRFPSHLEQAFRVDYFDRSIGMLRIALVLGIILYASFGVLDRFIAPETRDAIWIIRFAIVCPLLALTLGTSFLPLFRRIMQPAMALTATTAGLGIVAMIALSAHHRSGLYYYAGLILVIMWGYTMARLRFVWASVSCWIIVAGYEATTIYIQGLLDAPDLALIFINNNFFFIAANVIGMVSCFLIERYTRRDFLQRLLIVLQQQDVLRERNELKYRNDIMNNELDLARTIQLQIIPQEDPASWIASFFKPMEPVGGDLFDFIRFRDRERLGIFISDVSGHGVPAALITSMIKSYILSSGSDREDPARLLHHLNDQLANQTAGNFVTAFYGIYNRSTRTLIYASAGHNPPYRITARDAAPIEQISAVPLAVFDKNELAEMNIVYTNDSFSLEPGEKLLFYTDGLTEASRMEPRRYLFENEMPAVLTDLRNESCRNLVDALYARLVAFRGSDQFEDDICIICLDIE